MNLDKTNGIVLDETASNRTSIVLLLSFGAIFLVYLFFDWQVKNESFQVTFSIVAIIAGVFLAQKRNSELVRKLLMVLASFCALRFILWRLLFTLNLTSPLNSLCSFLLFGAECYAVIVLLMICLQNWYLERKKSIKPFQEDFYPSVDVFVVTYNEPVEILRRTLCGARAIDYENKMVYVLDDGRRDEIMQLALELGIEYITRPDNKFAKAGNINNALKQTNGEFVLILDADHIPCTTILERCIPYFIDPRMAVVQTPHRFMNAAPIQRNLHLEGVLPHEQELFFQVSMIGKDYWNAAIFAGSAGVIRRSVMEEVGGMSVQTVVEDCEFSMEIHRRGYRTTYLPEPQTIGLCPETLGAYLTQQSRWAKGQTQMLVMMNPFIGTGLTFAQRISYLTGNLYYLFGIPRLMFIVIPCAFLIFGVCATTVSFFQYMAICLPFLVLYLLSQNYTFSNFRHTFWSDVYEMVLAPYTAYWTIATILDPRAPSFAVTPKGLKTDVYRFELGLVWYHVILLLFCLFAILVGVVKLTLWFDVVGTLANVILTIYNVFILLCAIFVGIERPQLRRVHRVRRKLPVTLDSSLLRQELAGFTEDASEYGVRIRLESTTHRFSSDEDIRITFTDFKDQLMTVNANIVRSTYGNDQTTLEISFKDVDVDTRARMIVTFYCSPDTWAVLTEPGDSILFSFASLVSTPPRMLKAIRELIKKRLLMFRLPRNFKITRLFPTKLKPLVLVDSDANEDFMSIQDDDLHS